MTSRRKSCDDENRGCRALRVGTLCRTAKKEMQLLASVCASILIRGSGGGGGSGGNSGGGGGATVAAAAVVAVAAAAEAVAVVAVAAVLATRPSVRVGPQPTPRRTRPRCIFACVSRGYS